MLVYRVWDLGEIPIPVSLPSPETAGFWLLSASYFSENFYGEWMMNLVKFLLLNRILLNYRMDFLYSVTIRHHTDFFFFKC